MKCFFQFINWTSWVNSGKLLNIMSSYGWYDKSLRQSHNYWPVYVLWNCIATGKKTPIKNFQQHVGSLMWKALSAFEVKGRTILTAVARTYSLFIFRIFQYSKMLKKIETDFFWCNCKVEYNFYFFENDNNLR